MYISGKYWETLIGSTDDSLTLVDYLVDKGREELPLRELFADTGLDKLNWDFRQTRVVLEYRDRAGRDHEFYYAIDLITDLAALLLECKVSGALDLEELSGEEPDPPHIRITATHEELERLDGALGEFIADPLAYDLSEMCPEEDMEEMAALCKELRGELFS